MPPTIACPFPRWLQSWRRDRGVIDCGYRVPSPDEVQENSYAIQFWEKEWPRNLVEEVLEFAGSIRAQVAQTWTSGRLRLVCNDNVLRSMSVRMKVEQMVVQQTPRLAMIMDNPLDANNATTACFLDFAKRLKLLSCFCPRWHKLLLAPARNNWGQLHCT